MKKFFMMFEDLWVAATLAEAGIYEVGPGRTDRPVYHESAHLHAA